MLGQFLRGSLLKVGSGLRAPLTLVRGALGFRDGANGASPSGPAVASGAAAPDHRLASELRYGELLAEDFATHDRDLFEPGFWAVRLHRFATRTASVKVPAVRAARTRAYRILFTVVDWKWGIQLPNTVELGRRVRLWHHGCMRLDARSIGNDVHIRQCTTLGSVGNHQPPSPAALPVIADGVDIGSGTCVIGPVTIGRDALVGANSLVLEDVPPGANVLGVPARTLPVWSIGTRSTAVDGSTKDAGRSLSAGDRNDNPGDIALPALLAEDFRTHGSTVLSPGFWALAVHRLGNWRMGIRPRAIRAPLSLAYQAAYQGVVALWGIDLPYNAKVGRRLRIWHHGALFMGAREIGDDVQVQAAVTMGLRRRSDPAAPTIGNRVLIGANACIVGNIHIGDDSVIGANTVLARDVPPSSTVLGIPGRRINPIEYFGSVKPMPPVRPVQPPGSTEPDKSVKLREPVKPNSDSDSGGSS